MFKEINLAVIDLKKKYGSEKITTVLNTSSKKKFDFYFQQMSSSSESVSGGNEAVLDDFYIGDAPCFESQLLTKIDSCPTTYFLYGWSNFRSPYEIPEMIKRKFPCIVYDEKHFNSQITLFGKNDSCKRDTIFYSHAGFESPLSLRSEVGGEVFDSTKIDTSVSHAGKHSLNIESKNEFCITLKTSVATIFPDNKGCVNISVWVLAKDTFNAQMVMDVGQPNGKREWQGKLLNQFVKKTEKWQEVFVTFEIPSSVFPDDEVAIYLWNPGKNSFYLDDLTVSSFADSKYNYYEESFRK